MRLVRHCHRLPRAVAESPPAEMLRPRHREVLLLLLHPDPTAHTKAGAARCNLCHHRQQHADGSGAEPQWDGLARTTYISLPCFTKQPAQPPSVNSRASDGVPPRARKQTASSYCRPLLSSLFFSHHSGVLLSKLTDSAAQQIRTKKSGLQSMRLKQLAWRCPCA